jgi:low affinity Fe/Cu permease|tara:strand:+ start:361 stop:684 length:324 start_codon:yes stop_codon:yes gene_type:complete
MYQDIILLTTIFIQGVWVIKKYYDISYKIKDCELAIYKIDAKLQEQRVSNKEMQDDLIQSKQNDININAKYKKEIEQIYDRLFTLTNIVKVNSLTEDHPNLQPGSLQ